MSAHYYLQLLVALGVMLGILVLVQRLGRFMYQKKYQGDIKVIDRAVVDASVSFVIMSIRGKEYLVGVGGKEIQVFEEIESS